MSVSDDRPTPSRRRRALRWLFLAAGFLLLLWLLWRLDLAEVAGYVDRLGGFGLAAVFGLSAVWKCTNTASWRLAFPPGSPAPSYGRLLTAYLAGDAANLLPTASLGGEVARVWLLRRRAPASAVIPSLTINKTAEILAGILVATAALGVALFVVGAGPQVGRRLVVGILVASAAGALLYAIQRRRPVSRLLGLWGRLSPLSPERIEAAARIDDRLSEFYARHPCRFLGSCACQLTGRLVSVAETYVLVLLLGHHVSWSRALLIDAAEFVVKITFFFVPTGVGTLETGYSAVFVLLGLPAAAGLAAALVKRLVRLVWIAVGLLAWRLSESGSS